MTDTFKAAVYKRIFLTPIFILFFKAMEKSYIELSKPLLAEREINLLLENNTDLHSSWRAHQQRTNEANSLLLALVKSLDLPTRVLQNTCYAYQRFYLFNGNYKKYQSSQIDVAISSLFYALKCNDFIVKLNNVLQESNTIRKINGPNVDIEEQKRVILGLEKKIMEFQSLDFRSSSCENLLMRFIKGFPDLKSNVRYLSWCILNDLYFTKLILIYPSHINAIIAINCAILIHNELAESEHDHIQINYKKLEFDFDIKEVNNGCNIMMERYVDNLTTQSFLSDALVQLKIHQSPMLTPSSPSSKRFQDNLINIKIELNKNISDPMSNIKQALKDDTFFKPRDNDVSKNGSIRFLYNRNKYTNEVLSKKA